MYYLTRYAVATLAISVLITSCSPLKTLVGQDGGTPICHSMSSIFLSVGADCQLRFMQIGTGVKPQLTQVSPLLILECDAVQEELSLSRSQKKEIQKETSKLRTDLKSIFKNITLQFMRKQWDISKENPNVRAVEQWLEDVSSMVEKILLPNQVERFHQIARTIDRRDVGWQRSLKTIVRSGAVEDFSDRDVQKLASVLRDAGKQLEVESREISQSFFDDIVDVLTSDQKKKLEETLSILDPRRPQPPVCLLIWQFGYLDDPERPEVSTSPATGRVLEETYPCLPIFELDRFGQLVRANSGSKMPSHHSYEAYTNVLEDSNVAQVLGLSVEQQQQIGSVQADEAKRFREVSARHREDPEKLKWSVNQLYEDVSRDCTRDLINVLLPHQRNALDQLATAIDYYRRGPVAAICEGPLKRNLDITEKQCIELKRLAKRKKEEILDKCREIEEVLQAKLLKQIEDEEVRKQLESYYGKPLKAIPFNLEYFAYLLDQER